MRSCSESTQEALEFVEKAGWKIIPCEPRVGSNGGDRIEKPLLVKGRVHETASKDPAQIRRWGHRWPHCMWAGLMIGHAALDFDTRWVRDWLFVTHGMTTPRGPLVLTPRGSHLYFARVSELRPGPANDEWPVELKRGKQVLTLPIGPVARKLGYRWVCRPWEVTRLPVFPQTLRHLWKGRLEKVSAEHSPTVHAFSRGRSLRAQGLDHATIERRLREEIEPDILSDRDLERTVRSVCKKPASTRGTRYRCKNGKFVPFPGNGYEGSLATNVRELEVETAARTEYGGRLARGLLEVLRTYAVHNAKIVRVSYPTLRAHVANHLGLESKPAHKSIRQALEFLNRLRLIEIPPAACRQVHAMFEKWFSVRVSRPPTAAERFLLTTGGPAIPRPVILSLTATLAR